jgi:hypothetical protein
MREGVPAKITSKSRWKRGRVGADRPNRIFTKQRTTGLVEARLFTEADSGSMHLLPKKKGDELPAIMH